MVYRSHSGSNLTPIWFLIGMNLLLFVVTLIEPTLILFLGLIPAVILDRLWTIITSLFVHGSIGHILANMITLYFFGRYLCALLGERKFLLVYFIGGILGNILYILLAPPLSIAIGNEAETESFCLSHTGPPPPLGSSHWRFLDNFILPKRGVAGSSWRYGIWSNDRLFL
jgi:membrane associated rhomboid family serine protease